MNATIYNKVISIMEEIKKFEEMREMWAAQQPDPVSSLMAKQCQGSKQDLIRNLLAELFRSGISMESF